MVFLTVSKIASDIALQALDAVFNKGGLSMRALFPCVVPLRVVALYALQSAGNIPASDWVRKYAKVNSEEGQALWK